MATQRPLVPDEALEKLTGKVARVFSADPKSPWMAGVLDRAEGPSVKFSGKVFGDVGTILELEGKWIVHPKFGRQFEAATGKPKMDESPGAFEHMLATDDRFSGIGPTRARRISECMALYSVDGNFAEAMLKHADEIAQHAGCSAEIVSNAGKVWNERKDYFDALSRLCDQGWSNAQAQSIVSAFGTIAPLAVTKDPYGLIGKIRRFGFRTVDAVAQKMGVKKDDPRRLEAGVAFCLDRIGEDGNTWTTRDKLIADAVQELRPDTINNEIAIGEALDRMIAAGLVHIDRSPTGVEMAADARLAAIEFEVFSKLRQGFGERPNPISLSGPRSQRVLPTLNDDQSAAVRGFANFRFGVMSGAAGVGKTYVVRSICEVAEENGMFVALCAPTGKAARKLAQSTGREGRTIHRLLEPTFDEVSGTFRFTRCAKYPIDEDLVVVDEVSMVDVRLMGSLLAATKPTTRMLFVGDHHQIPSVGPGAILRDMLMARHKYPDAVHVLTQIVRQAGVLARNTTAILDGLVVKTNTPAWGVHTLERGHIDSSAAMVSIMVDQLLRPDEPLEIFGRMLDPVWDLQVLAPMRVGPLGTYELNVELQKLRQRTIGNKPPPPTEAGKAPKPLPGDRVIWTKNDYELDLMNGTQAIVVSINKDGSLDMKTEDDREVTIPSGGRKNVEVAYAMTIHKAQGSQWPCVVLVISASHFIMQDRNLLYTGASRASESLTIMGDASGIAQFAKAKKSAARQTFGAFFVHDWQPRALAKVGELATIAPVVETDD